MRARQYLWGAILVSCALAGCRCQPPLTTVCEATGYFVAPDLSLIEGQVPHPPGRLGRRIPDGAILATPTFLYFKDPTHVEIAWFNVDLVLPEYVLFSPGEQAARSESQPGTIYWMSRSTTESSDIVHIGFTSPVCEDLDAILHEKYCWKFSREREPLVAELSCKQERLPVR